MSNHFSRSAFVILSLVVSLIIVSFSSVGISTSQDLSLPIDSNFDGDIVDFEPVTSGILRVGFVASFERFAAGYFFQTAMSPTRLVVTRLGITADGNVNGYFQPTFGQIEAGEPFRVRMDINMDTKTWSAILDDEAERL